MERLLHRVGFTLLLGLGLMLFSIAARADPPYRVARLSYESGGVSFSPAGQDDWSRASVNRPLITGDRLWADAGSRAELQLDGAALRIGDQTSLQLLNIDDRIAQVQLTQGEIDVRVWRLDPQQSVEIDTPNLAVVIRRPGSYRIDASDKYSSTAVTVRSGEATLYGEGNAFVIRPGNTWEFYDTALRDYDNYQPEPDDDLARFAASRDREWEASVSSRYVSREVIGFQELDGYGQWQQTPDYGWVWFPTRVAVGWAPYREGHWAWVEPWGWTWIDDAPWGFAPFHYGRWAHMRDRWCWVPGPMSARPIYAPALVAFIGAGSGVVGWFPLGPREVYRPAYPVSRDYFTRVNVTNTTINVTQVTNVYERRDAAKIDYRNQHVPGAVVAVPTTTFANARPVGRDAVRVRPQEVRPGAVMPAPQIAPARQSILGPQPASRRPPERVFDRPVIAQTQPPATGAKVVPAQRSAGPTPAPGPAPAPAAAPNANRPERERRAPPPRHEEGPPARIEAPGAPRPAPQQPRAATPVAPTPAPAPFVPPPAAAAPPAHAAPPAIQQRREEERARGVERQRERAPTPPVAPQPPQAPQAPQPPQVQRPAPAAPPQAHQPQPPRREEREQTREQRREQRKEPPGRDDQQRLQ